MLRRNATWRSGSRKRTSGCRREEKNEPVLTTSSMEVGVEDDFVDGDEECPHCGYSNYAGYERCMCCAETPGGEGDQQAQGGDADAGQVG